MSISTDAVQATDSEPASQAVVAAVATETGRDPIELRPLYEVFDPDALDALFESSRTGRGAASTRVEFTYAGCEVCVRGDGSVDATAIVD